MDRQLVYPGAIPLETDLLSTNRNTMVALAALSRDLLGSATLVGGLLCGPASPLSLHVVIGAGTIYSLQNLDGSAYSSLAADTTHQILKQGIILDPTTLSCPAPSTVGQSIVYLIQAAFQEVDTNTVVLPYYNASNPTVAYSGPGNSGTAQATVRQGEVILSAKAGIAATTGTQTAPAPDAGYVGLWTVTVANGQTTITSANFAQVPGAPFITATLRRTRNPFDDFGAPTDGRTDGTAAVLAALNSGFDIDGHNIPIAVSNTVLVQNVSNAMIRRLNLVAIGSTLSATVPMVRLASSAMNVTMTHCKLDGGKFAAGIDIIGGRCQFLNGEVSHHKGFGVWLNTGGAGDMKLGNTQIYEYSNGDTEFATDANFTSTNLKVSCSDAQIFESIIRWSAVNVHLVGSAATSVFENCHLYNGGAGVLTRSHPKNIVADVGTSNNAFNSCYLDDGECDLFSPAVAFNNCKAIWTSSRATLSYFIGLYANGQSGPYQFQSSDWQVASLALTDGTIPFIDFLPNSPNAWTGDFTKFMASTGLHAACENQRQTRLQVDSDPAIAYYGPGGRNVGVAVVVIDADTTSSSDFTKVPGMRSSGDILLLQAEGDIALTVTTDYTCDISDSGKVIYCNSASPITVSVPSTARAGWKLRVVQLGAGAVTVAFAASGTFNSKTGSAPWIITAQYGAADVKIQSNSSGTNPTGVLFGDIS